MTGDVLRKKHWRYSISEVTTMPCSFEEDVALYRQAGCTGIGVWGFKMEKLGWRRAKDILDASGLTAANCIPEGNSILPYALSPSPADPVARVEAFLPNMERMAKLDPESIVVITGAKGDLSDAEAHEVFVNGFRRIGQVASDLGVTVTLEPIHKSQLGSMTEIWDLPQALRMVEEIGQPSFKVLFDTWHLYDTPRIFDLIDSHIDMIGGVHIADWKIGETRSWADRAFPGEGQVRIAAFVNRLDAAGFKGTYDVEIFSDAGQFDHDYPDSLWKLAPEEIVRRATRIFREAPEPAVE